MKDFLDYILRSVLSESIKFEIEETNEEGREVYTIKVPQESVGLVIGKGGKTISAIRNLLKMKATLERKVVSVNVTEN